MDCQFPSGRKHSDGASGTTESDADVEQQWWHGVSQQRAGAADVARAAEGNDEAESRRAAQHRPRAGRPRLRHRRDPRRVGDGERVRR